MIITLTQAIFKQALLYGLEPAQGFFGQVNKRILERLKEDLIFVNICIDLSKVKTQIVKKLQGAEK